MKADAAGPPPDEQLTPDAERGVTLRSLAVGALLCVALTAGEPFGVLVVRGSALCADFSTGGAIFLFFLLIFGVNGLLRRLGPRLGLSSAELVTVYVMLVLASAIPSWGFTMNMMGLTGGLRYYASPENEWYAHILPHLKAWAAPTDDAALRYFFEGLPPNEALPWQAWAAPLFWWSTFILAVYLVMICVVTILRRQWVEHERLTFPLAQLPLEMATTASPTAAWPSLFRSKMMWAGFAVPALIFSYNGIQKYVPAMPVFELGAWLQIIPGVLYSTFFVRFEVIGLSYLVNTDVLLGLWAFAWYFMIEKAIFKSIGFTIGAEELYSDPGQPTEAYQAFGAVTAYVLIGLWVARKHLRGVFRKAFFNAPDVDDGRELLSYRAALIGLVIGLAYVVAWMTRSGLALGHALIFIVGALIAFLGLTKIICEAGLAYARTPVTPSALTHSIFGPAGLGPASAVNLGLALCWSGDTRTIVMTSAATGAKMGDAAGVRPRRLFGAMFLALVVGIVASMAAVLLIGYARGGMNLGSWQFGGMTNCTGTWMINHMPLQDRIGEGTSWGKLGFLGIGAALMSLLMTCRYRFPWWPIHPAGLAVGLTHPTFHVWFSIFIAWLIKIIVLKMGGISLYRRTRPVFLGMILGAFTTAGLWLVIDWLAGRQGSGFTLG
ncbi:MAG: hypothetical protein FJ290_28525 [Planctomycetes bacterium]|nr:hypothetical protein [Planctomycetota bacterium]